MEDQLQENTPHPDFVKGFNEGYIIAQYKPELAADLRQSMESTSERSQGFISGIHQYELEKDKSLYPDWIKNREQKDYDDITPDKEQDKDEHDLEYGQ